MSAAPDRLYVDFDDRALYEKLSQELDLFENKSRKEQFLFTMAIGFQHRARAQLSRRENWFLRKDLKPEDEALLHAVALAESDSVDTLSETGTVFKIAEEYAHAGLAILLDRVRSMEFGSFSKRFESELIDICSQTALQTDQEHE